MGTRYLRIEEIVRQPTPKKKKNGKSPTTDAPRPLLPLSRTAFYAAIRGGQLPKPTKIGRTSVWDEMELRAAIDALAAGSAA